MGLPPTFTNLSDASRFDLIHRLGVEPDGIGISTSAIICLIAVLVNLLSRQGQVIGEYYKIYRGYFRRGGIKCGHRSYWPPIIPGETVTKAGESDDLAKTVC